MLKKARHGDCVFPTNPNPAYFIIFGYSWLFITLIIIIFSELFVCKVWLVNIQSLFLWTLQRWQRHSCLERSTKPSSQRVCRPFCSVISHYHLFDNRGPVSVQGSDSPQPLSRSASPSSLHPSLHHCLRQAVKSCSRTIPTRAREKEKEERGS